MASTSSLTLIIFISYLITSSKAQKPQKNCPPTFNCGSIGPIGYPFTTIFNPNCGIIIINCTIPLTIGLSATGPWYDVIYTLSNNKSFLIGDKFFQNLVNDDTCTSMANSSFNFPKSSTVTVTSLYNETFWKCGKNYSKSGNKVKFHGIIKCKDFDVYNREGFSIVRSNVSNCTDFWYPQFLMVELSEKCSRCVNGGGYCQEVEGYKFQCINERKERTTLRLLLALGIPGGSIGITICALLLWCIRKRKLRSLTMATEKVSKHPMRMKTDIEKSKVYFSIPVFSYAELEEATHNFSPTRELGDGGFGTVYYGKLKDGREVAVKRLYERNYKQLERYMNEIEILASLRHQNLVTLYGCTSRQSRELLLVYEYLPNSTVADHLFGDQSKCGTLTWPVRMRIAIETATALSYLHASDIIHRDVKTRNILLDHNFCVKVADFGLSRLFPIEVTHISTAPQGTPGYLDPEYHQCYQLTDKSDVYSFGVVLIELISSLPAIDIGRKEDEINLSNYAMKRIQCCVFDELVDQRLGFYSNPDVKRMVILVAELAFQCLQHRKDFRPTMGEVLESLKKINSGEYGVYKVEEKEENDVWLLRNTESSCSPISVMEKWNTPTESR